MRLDLLRHGETTLSHTLRGHTDDELTENGWLQMQSTIQQYVAGGTNWDVIFSSPLQRCHAFAINLAEQLEIPLQLNMHIKEMYFGDWEGISTQSIYENEPELLANFWQFPIKYHAPNGESLEQFLQRVQVGFDEIHTQMKIHQWNRALVVTHGGVIKLLTCLARHKHLNDLLIMSAELGQLYSVKMYKNDSLSFEEIKE
ncbi:MAG: fructose-2,6-bisphosphatase [Acinetobacter sp. GWC1_38_13]|uniref:Histidine phosphatase family protein n=1 Tax=Acinetobacter junii TaxID=40215 RepID=A0A365PF30_ACIJU|nr:MULTISPECIES: histidine phosphatase family protein [Acinetobacter]OFW45444.1 MAG: fructose-2,6-bisphosphatase [Acinetobacter sp. GWC1_38_13]RBA33760.1 histidine phosphatase family protein [Acinetobacter junii]RBA38421.1 histidine phosphatase family protein [Acinetobacter junii]RBA42701.1 histidine phosphatase family protein [Acinetobacter junii]WLF71197.1 histidine phosphatase family protein [Acinetobacter junii]